MLEYLNGLNGPVLVNGVCYESVEKAIDALKNFSGIVTIDLHDATQKPILTVSEPDTAEGESVYRIKVRQYMTKPSSPEFDFHLKMNNDIPMPMRIMVGRKLKETAGMVRMELWGEITSDSTPVCMKCGKALTNPVSKYFGIGPECGSHGYINPFETTEQLNAAVAQVQEELSKVTWTGWVIKSAIEGEDFIEKRIFD